MDLQDSRKGSARTSYQMVALVTVWVDEGENHDAMARIAQHIVTNELTEMFNGSEFKIGDSGYGFETVVTAIDFVMQKRDLH